MKTAVAILVRSAARQTVPTATVIIHQKFVQTAELIPVLLLLLIGGNKSRVAAKFLPSTHCLCDTGDES
jgi:hypothetical protein